MMVRLVSGLMVELLLLLESAAAVGVDTTVLDEEVVTV